MGRWGYRLFEGDHDLDIACSINQAFGADDENKLELSQMVHQTDMLAPPEARAIYQSDEYVTVLQELIDQNRAKLDTGLGDRLMAKYRAGDSDRGGKYKVVVVGALMMRAGAKIKDDDLEYLKSIVPDITWHEGYTLAPFDEGFRGPGKRQFLAALDNYKAGVPRSFAEPSCFNCGKIMEDLGRALEKCGRCKRAWYCDQECQKAQWKVHKPLCVPPQHRHSLNV